MDEVVHIACATGQCMPMFTVLLMQCTNNLETTHARTVEHAKRSDKRCTEGAFFLRVVSLQFGNGLIVATLDGKLELFLPDVLELRIER